jgi:hypothetical protein
VGVGKSGGLFKMLLISYEELAKSIIIITKPSSSSEARPPSFPLS